MDLINNYLELPFGTLESQFPVKSEYYVRGINYFLLLLTICSQPIELVLSEERMVETADLWFAASWHLLNDKLHFSLVYIFLLLLFCFLLDRIYFTSEVEYRDEIDLQIHSKLKTERPPFGLQHVAIEQTRPSDVQIRASDERCIAD